MGRKLAEYTPVQWSRRPGEHTTFSYDFLGRLTDTCHADGSHERLFLDGEGNIIKKVHPNACEEKTKDGAGTVYDYDGENRLLRIRHPDGGTERFFYDGAGNRIKHVLPEQYDEGADDGPGWTYAYDKENRLLSVTGPDGVQETAYTYDLCGNCIRRRDENGADTFYAYDLAGRLVGRLEPAGEKEEKEEASDRTWCRTLYEYDACGNKIRETRCGGSYRADGTLLKAGTDLVLTFVYDARNRLSEVLDGQGAKACCVYDAKGNRIREEQVICSADAIRGRKEVKRCLHYAYDRAGRLVKKTERLDSGLWEDEGKAPETAVTLYSRDADGNITEIVLPEGYRISRSYDSRDRLVAERVEDTENGIDRTVRISYDKAGNIISVKEQGADGRLRKAVCGYDLKDRLIRLEEADGPVAEKAYDRDDRVKGEKRLLAGEEESWKELFYRYDQRGNLTESRLGDGRLQSRNRYDRAGNLTAAADGDGVEAVYRYGLQGEQREIITAGSRRENRPVQRLSYNARGQITGIEDGCGGRTAYGLDSWGRITSVRNAEGGWESYAYDQAGNIIETTDARGGVVRYCYNSMGKVCAVTDQSGNRETFRYDRQGRQTAHTDRNGTVTETSHNVDGNPVLQVCTDRNGNRQIMGTWEYDSLGHLKKSVAGGFCYTYEYRADGKLLKKCSSGRPVVSCTWFRDGSLKSLTDVTGRTVWYSYDGDGRLSGLKDDAGKILTEYRYTAAGRLKEILTPSGMNASYAYDCDGNLSGLVLGNASCGILLYDVRFTYDLNGNRTSRTGTRQDAGLKQREMATRYRYDAMNRLTEENRNGEGEKYACDLTGNRIRKEKFRGSAVDAVETYCYNERNELTERRSGGRSVNYTYDACGSLLWESEGEQRSEYRYDLLNRQSYVRTLEGAVQESRYDGEGLRAGLTENGKETVFLYYNREILTECDGAGMPVQRYISGLGLSQVQTMVDGANHGIHRDEQGSTVYLTGAGGETENSYLYDAFGNVLESRETIANRIRYTGQQYDQVSGQYYLRARYYNPVIGRFTQEDEYRGDGLNLYAYCRNNPVVYYDPEGYAQKGDCPPKQGENPAETPGAGEGGRGTKTGDFTNLEGSTVDDILDRIPDEATLRELHPVQGGATDGFEFKWVQDGQTYRARVHSADPGAPAGSNASNGWVVRIQRGKQYYDPTINDFRPAKYTNPNGDFFDESIMNNTHIPIKDPYNP